ncbi:MAG TPA: YicC/YloC family endoribonuclease [Planctomycetota bacterium]|nr:YicC/YloC family endoribonuclease [Planctomycetota bacterium]
MALTSMTGYGRAQRRSGALLAEAEARSVNGRFLSLRFRLPGELTRLEPRLESLLKSSLARGTVDLSVRVESDRRRSLPRIDARVLGHYRRALAGLGGGGADGGDGAALLALPGVISWGEERPQEAAIDRLALTAATAAVSRLAAARRAEGRRLASALRRELATLRRLLSGVRRRLPDAVAQQQQNLRRRLAALLDGTSLQPGDPGLARELALLADRSDISEELDRLGSHLAALGAALVRSQPAGRELDFLLQEVGREVNTLGSKCSDSRIAGLVIQAKAAVERLREQAANIE